MGTGGGTEWGQVVTEWEPRGNQVGTRWGPGQVGAIGSHSVSTWACLTQGDQSRNQVGEWEASGAKRGPHVVPTGPIRSPRGPHVVPTWAPRGPHLVPTWSPHGSHLVVVWESRGNHVGTTWGPRENLRSVAFSVFSACSRPRRPLVASLRQSWLQTGLPTMRWIRLRFGRGLPAHRPTSGQLSRRTLRCIIRSASVRA